MARGTLRAMFVSFILLFAIPDLTKPCIYLLNQGWKQKSVGERAKLVDVVFTGKVRRLYSLNELSQTYAADFEVLQVLKGRDIVDQVIDIHSSSQLKVFGFGEKRLCFSPVRPGEIHMVFAVYSPNTNVNLVARYDDIFGATSSVTKQNEDEVLNVLGWKPWSSWTQCTDNCGGGLQWRSRNCENQECEGKTKERRKCNSYECYGVKDVTHYLREAEKKKAGHWLIEKKKEIKLEYGQFLSLPTTRAFQYYFPDELSVVVTFRPVVFLDLYLMAIYNVEKILQLGIRIISDTIVFEFKASKLIFQVNMALRQWHSLAFSVHGHHVTLFWDCVKIGTQSLPGKFSFNPDPAGIMYFGKPRVSELKERFEVELRELYFVPDPYAAKQKCQVSHFVPKSNPKEPEGSGSVPGPDDEDGSGTTNYVDDHETEVELSWSEWSPCSHTCGKGIRKRVMMCDMATNREPGEECLKALQTEEVKQCHLMDCPAHCDHPCLNGGYCQRRNTCKCQPGYYGNSCEKVHCQVMCLNGGTCIGPLACRCPPGYSGNQCEKAVCSPSCKNGGKCIRPNVCRCPAGYSPPSCQPSCYPPCLNGGNCVGPNICLCPRMFRGAKCQQAVCSRSCLNGGRCYAPDTCSCLYGWQGKRCEQARCFPRCKNDGRCIRPNVCRCPRGAYGYYCQYGTKY